MMIIFNPAAGQRRARRLWRILDIMTESGVRVDLVETRYPGHATVLVRDAVQRGRTLIVAAGGDGTIAEVANGINGAPAQLGIIPLGTANVLAHELRLPFAPRDVAAALAFRRTRILWPGIVETAGSPRLFVQMVGAGFDAQVVHRIAAPAKRAFGRAAYVAQGLREVVRYRFRPIRVQLDGVPAEAGSVIISKGRLYGGAYTLAPCADPTAHGFTVALFERSGPFAALGYGAALTLNMIPRMPGIRYVRAQEIRIETDDVPAQADGDPAGSAPVTVRESATPLRVVVPD